MPLNASTELAVILGEGRTIQELSKAVFASPQYYLSFLVLLLLGWVVAYLTSLFIPKKGLTKVLFTTTIMLVVTIFLVLGYIFLIYNGWLPNQINTLIIK